MGDFVHSISHWPKASTPDAVQHCWDRLIATNPELASQAVALMPAVAAIAGNSPFLSDLILRHSALFQDLCHNGPETVFARVMDTLFRESAQLTSKAEMQKCLRVAKQQVALVTAFADISQHWEVMTVTDHLTAFADAALDIASRYILGQAARTGEIEVPDVDDPVAGSGLLILAMGKHGAHELNYS
ncbi:MAG: glutamine-synthetase adenylyltransferase, partial [Rickettsiales bacterium]|nr:glutamine-synthetase adenylyltransferase [Rickettsiales bacterium]